MMRLLGWKNSNEEAAGGGRTAMMRLLGWKNSIEEAAGV